SAIAPPATPAISKNLRRLKLIGSTPLGSNQPSVKMKLGCGQQRYANDVPAALALVLGRAARRGLDAADEEVGERLDRRVVAGVDLHAVEAELQIAHR